MNMTWVYYEKHYFSVVFTLLSLYIQHLNFTFSALKDSKIHKNSTQENMFIMIIVVIV